MVGQLELGELLKDEGQQLATSAATEWHDQAIRYIAALARDMELTADTLVAIVGLPNASATNKNNAVGAAFTAARRAGLICQTGWTRSARSESHSRVIAVWTRK